MIKPSASGHLALAWRSAWTGWKYLTLALARYTYREREREREGGGEGESKRAVTRSRARCYVRSRTCAARVARVVRAGVGRA